MEKLFDIQRQELLSASKAMLDRGLVTGTAGNASVRLADNDEWADANTAAFMVTPSSVPYEQLRSNDLVIVNSEIEPLDGESIPSTESLMHRAIYQARPDVQAIMHTHSTFATVVGIAGKPILPVIDELVVYVGGQVDVAKYGEPASDELAEFAVEALAEKGACLLRHHGMCAVGTSVSRALEICTLVEKAAQIYFYSELWNGSIELPPDAIERERAIYRMRSGFDV
ncbi:MAG: class II aldolase/adducin family protein [Chloroflexi bacterium]|nr:class II aldolase/adducin family protein [Chloroflexota bacterium]